MTNQGDKRVQLKKMKAINKLAIEATRKVVNGGAVERGGAAGLTA